jgi:hypothetical protein
MDEKCMLDQRHCTCVPALRKRLEAEERERKTYYDMGYRDGMEEADNAMRQALSDLEWIERMVPGSNLQASILLLRHALAGERKEEGMSPAAKALREEAARIRSNERSVVQPSRHMLALADRLDAMADACEAERTARHMEAAKFLSQIAAWKGSCEAAEKRLGTMERHQELQRRVTEAASRADWETVGRLAALAAGGEK